jgi:hypothetical protein
MRRGDQEQQAPQGDDEDGGAEGESEKGALTSHFIARTSESVAVVLCRRILSSSEQSTG